MRASEAMRAGEIDICGARLVVDPSGALWWPAERTLLVADLHFETGAAFARRGMMVPPYDTRQTLGCLARVVARHAPARVICLGDSFHDRRGAEGMPEDAVKALHAIMMRCDWLWITGNHDEASAAHLGGGTAEEERLGPLVLRHHPQPAPVAGEISGHLHPGAKIALDARTVQLKCVAYDATRAILPSFGALAGGLNVRARPFETLFDGLPHVMALGETRAYPVPRSRLV